MKKQTIDKELKIRGCYTSKALLPGSISSVHPDSLFNIFLQGYIEKNKQKDDEVNYLLRKVRQKCSANSIVREDISKRNLLKTWVEQDLCFSTKKEELHILPLCLTVSSLFPWKNQEPYHKILFGLLRAGRRLANIDIDLPLQLIYKSFKEGADDPESSIIMSGLGQSIESEWRRNDNQNYKDNVLCLPHCRVLQEDIENVFQWEVSRVLKLDFLKRLLLYHFCTLLLRMSFLIDDIAQTARNIATCYDAYSSKEIQCKECLKKYQLNSDSYGELTKACKYHPQYIIGEKSQKWFSALARYHTNIASVKTVNFIIDQRNKVNKNLNSVDDVLDFISLLKDNRAKHEEIKDGFNLLDKYFEETPPKSQAWEFFKRYASTEKHTSFVSRHIRGSFSVIPSKQLITIWAHIFISISEQRENSPLLVDFVTFLNERGIRYEGNVLGGLENELRLLGILKDYADMGRARELEPILPGQGDLQ